MVVDGGSTDGSVEIIQRYADRLAWWVSERDAGQAEAINKGLRRATGEIVAWLNSDDLYLPGAIGQAAAVFQEHPEVGMVFGDAITIDAQGKPLGRLAFGDWDLLDLVSFRIICQPAVFMRRAVLEKSGYLESSYHYMLDHHLWIRMARCAPIRYSGGGMDKNSKEPAALWAAARHHPGAKNVAQAPGFSRETMQVLEWMESQPDLNVNNRPKPQTGTGRRLSPQCPLSAGRRVARSSPGCILAGADRSPSLCAQTLAQDGLCDPVPGQAGKLDLLFPHASL